MKDRIPLASTFTVLLLVAIGCQAQPTSTTGECLGPEDARDASCRWYPTNNRLVMRVEGKTSGEGEVYVEYENDEAGRFRTTPVLPHNGRFRVYLPRLRSENTYAFQVYQVNGSGETTEVKSGAFTTGPLPEGLQNARFSVETGTPSEDLTFMDFNMDHGEEADEDDLPIFVGLVTIDGEGEIVWYVETDESEETGTLAMARKPNGNIVYIENENGLKEITPLGEPVRSISSPCNPHNLFHHELHLMPDGRVMTLGYVIRDVFDDPDRPQAGDNIWIWDQERGSMDEVWNVFDHIDATQDRTVASDTAQAYLWNGCEDNQPTEDWTHANSAKVAENGTTLFSIRHLNQVVAISPDFDEIAWRLGGPGSDFTFPDPTDRFYHQHSAYQLPNGNILLFDNGNTRPDAEGGEYSRALELTLDFNAMTATKVWEYKPDPPLFAPAVSNVERLENGNTLVTFGANADEVFSIVEAGRQGEAVWRATLEAPGLSYLYRAFPASSIWGEERVE